VRVIPLFQSFTIITLTDPGATRFALAPGYYIARLWRSDRTVRALALSAEFRDHPTEVVEERAFDTEEVFDQFKAEHRWAGRILSKADYHRMVHDSFLEVIKNNSPRHALTCELLATLRYNRAPELDITASLIHSSIALAKKHRKQLANI